MPLPDTCTRVSSLQHITKHSGGSCEQKVWKQEQNGSAKADWTICHPLSSFQGAVTALCKNKPVQGEDLRDNVHWINPQAL